MGRKSRRCQVGGSSGGLIHTVSGIGRALGRALARRGARVILADRHGDEAEVVAARLRAEGGEAEAARVVRNAAAVAAVIDWCQSVEVNLMRVIHGVVAAYPRLQRQLDCGLDRAPGAAEPLGAQALLGVGLAGREERCLAAPADVDAHGTSPPGRGSSVGQVPVWSTVSTDIPVPAVWAGA